MQNRINRDIIGTEAQWGSIAIGLNNDALARATIHYVCDPLPPVLAAPDLALPASLRSIADEAFRGITARTVRLGENVTAIGGKAFAGCANLEAVYIPESCKSIKSNAYADAKGLTLYGRAGSYAQTYAEKRGFTFVAVD